MGQRGNWHNCKSDRDPSTETKNEVRILSNKDVTQATKHFSRLESAFPSCDSHRSQAADTEAFRLNVSIVTKGFHIKYNDFKTFSMYVMQYML